MTQHQGLQLNSGKYLRIIKSFLTLWFEFLYNFALSWSEVGNWQLNCCHRNIIDIFCRCWASDKTQQSQQIELVNCFNFTKYLPRSLTMSLIPGYLLSRKERTALWHFFFNFIFLDLLFSTQNFLLNYKKSDPWDLGKVEHDKIMRCT